MLKLRDGRVSTPWGFDTASIIGVRDYAHIAKRMGSQAMVSAWLLLIAGLIVLVGGAELLVRGASALAGRFGVSPLVIGLTVVAFGTSAPEIAVSLGAVFDGKPDLAIGNAVGSNTFNVLFILGLSALMRPLIVQQQLVRIDVPIMIGASLLLWLLVYDGRLGRFDGLMLFTGIVAYIVLALRLARREKAVVQAEYEAGVPIRTQRVWLIVALIVAGLAGTVVGARWFVQGAVLVAAWIGMSELTIGLTVIAAGTSLPELATSLVAVVRGQRDIAVGNVIGSNIFNVLAIMGLVGMVAPESILVPDAVRAFDLPVMIAVAIACLPIVFTGHLIQRWEGGLLLAGYVAYLTYLMLDAGGHDALSGFSFVVLWFALPLAGLGIGASVISSILSNRERVQ